VPFIISNENNKRLTDDGYEIYPMSDFLQDLWKDVINAKDWQEIRSYSTMFYRWLLETMRKAYRIQSADLSLHWGRHRVLPPKH
jgi:hypothetical protein